jgi:hypothetical protein
MNHITPTTDNFDRLVDGELSESQRRELLTSLDHEPDGWRRCALAFLEAQSWKKEFGVIRQNMTADPSTIALSERPKKRNAASPGLTRTILAMAASFLLVLGAGILWQQSGNRFGGMSGATGDNQIAGKNGGPSATISSEPQTALADASKQPQNAAEPWQWVKLVPAGSSGSEQAVELPVVQRDRLDQQWMQNTPSPIPDNMLQALQRNGYAVQRQQELMRMPLKDGRRLVVPVDQVQVKYVGNQTY